MATPERTQTRQIRAKRPKWLPLREAETLSSALRTRVREGLDAENRAGAYRARDAGVILLGLHGLRSFEIANLRSEDLEDGRLWVCTAKGGETRSLPISQEFWDCLVALQETETRWIAHSEYIIRTRSGKINTRHIRTICHRLGREILGHPIKSHSLRHTFAVRLYNATKDILLVRKALGHRSLASTLVYADSLQQIPEECLPI